MNGVYNAYTMYSYPFLVDIHFSVLGIYLGLFKISVSSFTSNICGIPGVEIWNPKKNWVPKSPLVNISG